MNIVLCTLHVRRSSQAVPLAAGCLAAALPENLRKQVTLLDLFPEQPVKDIVESIHKTKPDVVLFPVYVWNRQQVIQIAKQLHKDNPDILLVGGGPEATGDTGGLINAAPWTALVYAEGETVFADLLEILSGKAGKQPLPGLVWANDVESQCKRAAAELDLGNAKSPWLSGTLKISPGAGVLWEVARGCAFSCDYCFEARGRAGVRQIPRSRLEAELELFVEKGVSQVWVLDSTFNYPPERGIQLLEMLLDKAPQLHYHFEAKADYLDRKTINLLGSLDCSVQIGLQSVHEEVLKSIHRPLDLEILAEKVHLLDAEGIVYGFDLIYGLPGDNYEGFRQSIDSIFNFSPNHVHIFPLSVLPGTRLAQQRERHGISAQPEPPYELLSSRDWPVEEIKLCRQLATAIDLFYNTGRAVAFFPAILDALNMSPSELFVDFYRWLSEQSWIEATRLINADNWSAEDVYRMLQGYVSHQLKTTGQRHLVSIFLDMLCYHYHYAETLLGEELPPATDKDMRQDDIWERPWKRSPVFRLVPFAYEILDLLEVEEIQLSEIATLFRPVGSVALFMRRNNEVICESLGEEMLQLLKQSNGQNSPKDIFAGSVPKSTGEELVRFAVSEGLLKPVEASAN